LTVITCLAVRSEHKFKAGSGRISCCVRSNPSPLKTAQM
jgi:hypothetical protein